MSWEVSTMRSKTSCFNTGIAKNLLRRSWPIFIVYLLVLLLVPFVLFSSLQHFDPVNDLSPGLDMMLGRSLEPMLLLALLTGVVTAMAMFGFLYSSRSCGLLNCLPVDRSCLFFTAFLTGGLALLAADLLGCGVTALLCLSGYLSFGNVLRFFAAQVLSKTFFYGFAVFCAMLTGNMLVLPGVYLVLNFTAIIAELSTRDVLSKVIYGMTSSDTRLSFLSPLIPMFRDLDVRYIDWPKQARIFGIETTALYALAGLVFVLLAWRLFRSRRMETAGDTVAIRALKPTFKYCMCFGSAVVFASLLYALLDPQIAGKSAALFLLLLLLAGAFLGYFAACMMIEKSFRVFRGQWKGFFLSAALIVLLLGACEFDLFGVEKRVPKPDEVRLVVLNGVELKENESLSRVVDYQESLIAHKDKQESAGGPWGEYMTVNEAGTAMSRIAEIRYILKNGKTVNRIYHVRGSDADFSDPGSDLRQLEELLNCQEALEFRCTLAYPITANTVVHASLTVDQTDRTEEAYYGGNVFPLTAEELADFWNNGVLPDLAEGHIARRTVCEYERGWSYTDAQVYLCLVEDRDAFQREGGLVNQQQWMNVQIATDSVHCLDWIEKHTGIRPSAADSFYADEGYGLG